MKPTLLVNPPCLSIPRSQKNWTKPNIGRVAGSKYMVDSPGIFTLCTWICGFRAGTSPIAMRMKTSTDVSEHGISRIHGIFKCTRHHGNISIERQIRNVHMFEEPQIHVVQLETVHAITTDTSCGKFEGGKNNSGLVCL